MNYTSDHRRTMSYTKISQRFEYFFINLMAIINLKPLSLFNRYEFAQTQKALNARLKPQRHKCKFVYTIFTIRIPKPLLSFQRLNNIV